MAEKVSIYLFDKHIADLFIENEHVIMRQYNNAAHIASPISIPENIQDIDTTSLVHL